MYNLTDVNNNTEPKLPENPLIYFEEYNNKLLMWMSPLLLLTVWVNIYIVFNIVLYFAKDIMIAQIKRIKLYVQGNLNVKKGVKIV